MKAAFTQPDAIDPQLLSWAQGYLKSLSLHEQPQAEARQAWDMFYQSCDQFIRSVCTIQGVSRNDLDDTAQEVWASLLVQLMSFEHDPQRGKVQTWLFAVIRNTVIDGWRRKSRRTTCSLDASRNGLLADTSSDPVCACERHESQKRIRSAMSRLKSQLSEVNFRLAQMRWFEQRSVAETAEALHLSTHQVWFRQHRIKKKLKAYLEQC